MRKSEQAQEKYSEEMMKFASSMKDNSLAMAKLIDKDNKVRSSVSCINTLESINSGRCFGEES
jgi:hypothetical protein